MFTLLFDRHYLPVFAASPHHIGQPTKTVYVPGPSKEKRPLQRRGQLAYIVLESPQGLKCHKYIGIRVPVESH